MTSNPTSEGLVQPKPVAWRYHFTGDGRAVHWTLTQRPIESRDAQPGLCATIAEPLFSEALVTSLRNQLEGAKEALRPFAALVPSSLYPDDGSENETYTVYLGPVGGGNEFTGADLARARLAASTLYGLEGDQEVRSSNASPSPLAATRHSSDLSAEPAAEQWLRDVGGICPSDGQWDECWVPCAKGDPGARLFVYSGERGS